MFLDGFFFGQLFQKFYKRGYTSFIHSASYYTLGIAFFQL